MALSTYAELKQAVADWLDRDDLAAFITDFISLGEVEIFDEARFRIMELRDNAFSIDGQYVNVPSDYLEAKRLSVDNGNKIVKIEFVDNESMVDNYIATNGWPEFFTTIGSEFEFNRIPDETYTATLVYYAKPDSLSDSQASNVLFAAYPNLYLYGALIQAEPFLGNDQRLATWKVMYQTALSKGQAASDKALHSGSALTIRNYGPTA